MGPYQVFAFGTIIGFFLGILLPPLVRLFYVLCYERRAQRLEDSTERRQMMIKEVRL